METSRSRIRAEIERWACEVARGEAAGGNATEIAKHNLAFHIARLDRLERDADFRTGLELVRAALHHYRTYAHATDAYRSYPSSSLLWALRDPPPEYGIQVQVDPRFFAGVAREMQRVRSSPEFARLDIPLAVVEIVRHELDAPLPPGSRSRSRRCPLLCPRPRRAE